MLKLFIGFFIFCIVLFIYLHIQFHLKTSNDLEVFELDQASKDKLDEICDLDEGGVVHAISNFNMFFFQVLICFIYY